MTTYEQRKVDINAMKLLMTQRIGTSAKESFDGTVVLIVQQLVTAAEATNQLQHLSQLAATAVLCDESTPTGRSAKLKCARFLKRIIEEYPIEDFEAPEEVAEDAEFLTERQQRINQRAREAWKAECHETMIQRAYAMCRAICKEYCPTSACHRIIEKLLNDKSTGAVGTIIDRVNSAKVTLDQYEEAVNHSPLNFDPWAPDPPSTECQVHSRTLSDADGVLYLAQHINSPTISNEILLNHATDWDAACEKALRMDDNSYLLRNSGVKPAKPGINAIDDYGEQKICRFWKKNSCWRGAECTFAHDGPGGCVEKPKGNTKATKPPASKPDKTILTMQSKGIKKFLKKNKKEVMAFIETDKEEAEEEIGDLYGLSWVPDRTVQQLALVSSLKASEGKIYIKMAANGKDIVWCMLDSGSDLTGTTLDVLHRTLIPNDCVITKQRLEDRHAKAANGSTLKCVDALEFNLNLATNKKLTMHGVSFETLAEEIIIGLPQMIEWGLVLDLPNMKAHFTNIGVKVSVDLHRRRGVG